VSAGDKVISMLQKKALTAMRAGDRAWRDFAVEYQREHEDEPLNLSRLDFTGITFDNFDFPMECTFEGSVFDMGLMKANFGSHVSFNDCMFTRSISIDTHHQEDSRVSFERTTFRARVDFHAMQNANTNFEHAEFKGALCCSEHVPEYLDDFGALILRSAKFHDYVRLNSRTFGLVDCADAVFENVARFENSKFAGGVNFRGAVFKRLASFENAEFLSSSSFRETLFLFAPNFHNSELHQGTLFSAAPEFPRLFLDIRSPGAAEAYRTLKLAMNKQHALSEEAGFFLLEMRSRALTEPLIRRSLYQAYDVLSMYGQSVKRPFLWFVAINILFGAIYSALSGQRWETFDPQITALTLFGAVPFAAALRWPEIAGPSGGLFPSDRLVYVQLAIVMQSVLAGVLLFLIGLGLRNMFKIR
jgi:hypothetical protein